MQLTIEHTLKLSKFLNVRLKKSYNMNSKIKIQNIITNKDLII